MSINPPHVKLQTTSSTPPPTVIVNSTTGSLSASNASSVHRKLFHMEMPAMIPAGGPMLDNNGLIDNTQQIQHDFADQLNGRTMPPDLSNIYNTKRSDSYFMSDELR